MRFKKGDRVLVLGNAHGMNIQDVCWPLRGMIFNVSRCNIAHDDPAAVPGFQYQEYYQVVIDDPVAQKVLTQQGYIVPGRWVYPASLLRRDKFCPVCGKAIETYSDRNLVSEHEINGDRCYGSHFPLEL